MGKQDCCYDCHDDGVERDYAVHDEGNYRLGSGDCDNSLCDALGAGCMAVLDKRDVMLIERQEKRERSTLEYASAG